VSETVTVAAPSAPTSDERTLAMLAHILQMFSWFIGPLVILLVKRESRFVSFHAIQALIWQATFAVVSTAGVFVVVALAFIGIPVHPGSAAQNAPTLAFFAMFSAVWLFCLGGWVVTLILAIVYGIKANQGEWACYPIIGGWARRLAKV